MTPILRTLPFVTGLMLASPSDAAVCQVPLKIVNIGTSDAPMYKIGINVGLGGGAPRLYEFDTGGAGFWAAYDGKKREASQWWGAYTPIAPGSMSIQYTSGNEYTANLVGTQVALFDPKSKTAASPLCTTPDAVQISQITQFSNSYSKNLAGQWNRRLAHGQGPLFKHFWGDFGAALHPAIGTTNSQGAYTVLNQFQTGAAHNGFIVHVGDLTQPGRQSPYVQIGLNTADIMSFPYQFPMNPECSAAGPYSHKCPPWTNFSNTSVDSFAEAQFNADVVISGPRTTQTDVMPGMGIIIDSGATLANIFQNPTCVTNCAVSQPFIRKPAVIPDVSPVLYAGPLKNGYSATVTGTTNENTTFCASLTQTAHPLNSSVSASYSASKAASGTGGTMNTGVLFYSDWDVMYDVTAGIIGFRPSTKTCCLP